MAIFIKYGPLNGEATAKGYEKWMEVNSFQWGVGRGISSGVGGGSKREATAPSVSEITVTKTMDAISPLILKEAIGGDSKEVKIHMTQTDSSGKHIARIMMTQHYPGKPHPTGPEQGWCNDFPAGKFEAKGNSGRESYACVSTGHAPLIGKGMHRI